jgi:F420H(2)-dependent biliverdin reductase
LLLSDTLDAMTAYPTAEVEQRLRDEANVWMATVRADGRAHLVPIWFVWVLGKFWICTGTDTVKMRNLRTNPSIALSLENGDAPVIAKGMVEFVEAPYPAEVLAEFVRKYQWDLNGDDAATHSVFSSTPAKWIHWNA